MSRLPVLLSIALLLPFCGYSAQEVNPLLGCVGKSYGAYHDTFKGVCDSLFEGPRQNHDRLLQLLAEAAAADPTGEWELNRRLIVVHT